MAHQSTSTRSLRRRLARTRHVHRSARAAAYPRTAGRPVWKRAVPVQRPGARHGTIDYQATFPAPAGPTRYTTGILDARGILADRLGAASLIVLQSYDPGGWTLPWTVAQGVTLLASVA